MADHVDDGGEPIGAENVAGLFGDAFEDDAPDASLDTNPAARMAHAEAARMVEALIFASAEPVTEKALAARMPDGIEIAIVMDMLRDTYDSRGVNLVRVGDAWAFRTATDLAFLMSREQVSQRKLSRAALEVLAIVAYHQPVTRAEMEEIRGVETSKGTLDVLLESGWVKMRGRRKTPGRPVTYGTTTDFLDHFGLSDVRDLPGMDELKAAGLLSSRLPAGMAMPAPTVDPDQLTDEEEPLEDIDLEELGLLTPAAGND